MRNLNQGGVAVCAHTTGQVRGVGCPSFFYLCSLSDWSHGSQWL